jgi:hypothetical protein
LPAATILRSLLPASDEVHRDARVHDVVVAVRQSDLVGEELKQLADREAATDAGSRDEVLCRLRVEVGAVASAASKLLGFNRAHTGA